MLEKTLELRYSRQLRLYGQASRNGLYERSHVINLTLCWAPPLFMCNEYKMDDLALKGQVRAMRERIKEHVHEFLMAWSAPYSTINVLPPVPWEISVPSLHAIWKEAAESLMCMPMGRDEKAWQVEWDCIGIGKRRGTYRSLPVPQQCI